MFFFFCGPSCISALDPRVWMMTVSWRSDWQAGSVWTACHGAWVGRIARDSSSLPAMS